MLINIPANEVIVIALQGAGVTPSALTRYTSEMPLVQDNLEILSSYWIQKLCQHGIHTREIADICLFLMDTQSKMLWVSCFKTYVIPILLNHRILE